MAQTLRIEAPSAFEPLLAPSRYKGAYGGRGSGKSHFFATQLIIQAIARRQLRAVCVREVQRSLEQSVKRLLEDKIEQLGVGDSFRVLNTHIETPGDGIIIFQGMQHYTAENIKSLEGYDIAWVEEAQALSQRSLDLLRPTIRKEDSELWFSWNPRTPTDPVDSFLRGEEGPPPGSTVVEVSWEDNPWFPDVLREELEWDRRRDTQKYQHIWGGGYQQRSEAQVFRNWRIEDFDTPPDARFYFGADWGYSVDPSVLVRCWIDGRRLYVDYEAYQIGCEIDRLPDLLGSVPGAREWPIIADSARPETISYLNRHGFPSMKGAKKGAGSVPDGVEFLRSYDIIVHPRCRHTADELATYCYKLDKLTDEVLPVLEDKKNHVIDSLRYALESVRGAGPPGSVGRVW